MYFLWLLDHALYCESQPEAGGQSTQKNGGSDRKYGADVL